MAFNTATPDVTAVLIAGGLRYAEALVGLDFTFDRIVSLLRERYTPIGQLPFNYNVYAAVVNRAVGALLSGRQMESWQTGVPFPKSLHVGLPGLTTQYQYTVIGTFLDPDTGREFTRPFVIGSATNLSAADALAEAVAQAFDYVSAEPTLPALAGHEPPIPQGFRISDALVRI